MRLDPVKEAQAVAALRSSMEALAGEDEILLLDTIEGETGLLEAVDALLNRMTETRALIVGTEAVASELDVRKRRFEARLETDRALIEQALMIAELDKLERPTATLSLAKRQPRVEVQTESDVPARFWKAADPKLDKKALLDALKAGEAVPGACLSNAAPTLSVRSK